MVIVEVSNKSLVKYKKSIAKASEWLLHNVLVENAPKAKAQGYFLEVFLVGDEFMHKNVLSFPHPQNFPRPDVKQIPLGEIYLNPKYIEEHEENLVFMLIHGFLHLLGYDHIKKSDRIAMEKREQELLSHISKIA
jgi:rRNA maturation RNase YbeY